MGPIWQGSLEATEHSMEVVEESWESPVWNSGVRAMARPLSCLDFGGGGRISVTYAQGALLWPGRLGVES